jgi:hypothetical protein
MSKPATQLLKLGEIESLGRMLIELGDLYPNQLRTESDFYPLVYAYLVGRFPAIKPEYSMQHGEIDFRIGGSNPFLLELALQPRALQDVHHREQVFPGHDQDNKLYGSQNMTELKKLFSVPQTQAKNRYLLLIDFRDAWEEKELKSKYEKASIRIIRVAPVNIIYVSRKKSFRVLLHKERKKI